MSKVYIASAVLLSGPDPDFRPYIPPMQARRMGLLQKRAVAVGRQALEQAGVEMPDAILCGTALGCMEPTRRILDSLHADEAAGVSPTDFMQSTHNTLASTIAIQLGCKGYNCTYAQGAVSFESALWDAFLQLKAGLLGTALVLAADEEPAPGLCAAVVLGTQPAAALCELADVRIFHGSQEHPLPADARPLQEEEPMAKALCQEVLNLSHRPGYSRLWRKPNPDGSDIVLNHK